MTKLAVFVEGLTEQEFTIKLLTEIAGAKGITFEIRAQHKGVLSFVELRQHHDPATNFMSILIVNCCNDDQVKSQIKDQYASLVSAGYSKIIGLKDIYPLSHAEIPKVQSGLHYGLPNGMVPIEMHLAILEIEAWFLEEITHFSKISPKLSPAEIIANGFDYLTIRACDLPHPAATLDAIYKAAGRRYKKTRAHILRTINALSFEEIYINCCPKSLSLNNYIVSLEASFP